MKAFFDRHEVDKKGATWDEQGKGWQAWNGWGGDAGYAWARKVVRQMEARDKKTEFVAGRDCGQDDEGTFGPDNKCAVGYGRPPLKGGYEPKRPGGKFPKDYKRPTPQDKKEEKPQPPKPPTQPNGKPGLPPPPAPPTTPAPKRNTSVRKNKEVENIENSLIADGFGYVDLPDDAKTAQIIKMEIYQLKKAGYGIPTSITRGERQGGAMGWVTAADNYQTISLNHRRAADWKRLTELEEFQEKTGFWSSKSVIAHEYGHSLHAQAIGQEGFRKYKKWANLDLGDRRRIKKIAGQVSKYAQADPLEFVAETFAGHVSGKRCSAEVYEAYNKLRGPKLKF